MALFDKNSLIGCRVVKELDWRWIKQNGVKGQLGTVREAVTLESYIILWDNGQCDNPVSTSSLRVYDSGPSGIRPKFFLIRPKFEFYCFFCYFFKGLKDHKVACNSCKSPSIIGIAWECSECPEVKLCNVCYHSDKHDLRHRFNRILTNWEEKALIDCRKKSKKIQLKGILPNTKVKRGPDWQWGDQDGGNGKRGVVAEIKDWQISHPRSGVYIHWHNKAGIYRLGFEGKCDVQTVANCKGISVYFDHLPFLNDFLPTPQKAQLNLGKQENWLNNMFECLRIAGTSNDKQDDEDESIDLESLGKEPKSSLHSTINDSLPSTSSSLFCSNSEAFKNLNHSSGEKLQSETDCNEKVLASVIDVYQSFDSFSFTENRESFLYKVNYPKNGYILSTENEANTNIDTVDREVVDLCGIPWVYTPLIRESKNEPQHSINKKTNHLNIKTLDHTSSPFISPSKTCLKSGHSSNKINPKVHSQIDYSHHLVPDLWSITNSGYYWGKMNRYEADKLLENKPEGTFLLRDSTQEEYIFSVSFRRLDHSIHARVEQFDHRFSFYSHDPTAASSTTICGLIQQYTFKDPRQYMYFGPMLTTGLNRNFVFSLQQLARARICSTIKYDAIDDLELPFTLRNFLKEYHYKQKVRVKSFDDVI